MGAGGIPYLSSEGKKGQGGTAGLKKVSNLKPKGHAVVNCEKKKILP